MKEKKQTEKKTKQANINEREKKIRLLVEGKNIELVDKCMIILEKSVENDLQ